MVDYTDVINEISHLLFKADPKTVTEIFVYLASDESKAVHGQRFEAQDEDEEATQEAA